MASGIVKGLDNRCQHFEEKLRKCVSNSIKGVELLNKMKRNVNVKGT